MLEATFLRVGEERETFSFSNCPNFKQANKNLPSTLELPVQLLVVALTSQGKGKEALDETLQKTESMSSFVTKTRRAP